MSAVAHRLCVHFCVARGRNGADRGGSFEMALDRIIEFWNSLPKRASVVEWQTRKFQVLVPPGHEGSTPFGCTIFDSSSGRGRRISFFCVRIPLVAAFARILELRGNGISGASERSGVLRVRDAGVQIRFSAVMIRLTCVACAGATVCECVAGAREDCVWDGAFDRVVFPGFRRRLKWRSGQTSNSAPGRNHSCRR